MNRRTFLRHTAQAGLMTAAAPIFPLIRPKFQTYRIALIGAGWWGNNILREAVAAGNSKVIGICDVDERALQDTQKNLNEWTGEKPRHYRDYRELLNREKPDIAIIGTPDHWHALPAIAAMKAGAISIWKNPLVIRSMRVRRSWKRPAIRSASCRWVRTGGSLHTISPPWNFCVPAG